MSVAQRIIGIAILVLPVFLVWSSVTHSQDKGRRRSPIADDLAGMGLPERSEPTTPAPTDQAPTSSPQIAQRKPSTMTAEEKMVRDVYTRLMRYQSAARDELAARKNLSSGPSDYVTFQMRKIHTGNVAEIYYRPLSELVTERSGATIRLTPTHLSIGNDPAHAYYEAEWIQIDVDTNSADPGFGRDARLLKNPITNDEEPIYPVDRSKVVRTNTVGEMLRKGGERYAAVAKYTSYEVTVSLAGRERTYKALVLYFNRNAAKRKDDERVNPESASEGQLAAEVLDNVISDMNTLVNDESPRVRSPWDKYVTTSTYAAVTRTIREAKAAGKPLRPADAPIGYLPGDDVVPSKLDMQRLTAVACPTPPPVASLQASIPSTKNAATGTRPDPGVFTTANSSTAFATAATTDMAVTFQGGTQVTIIAQGINPPTLASQLRWKIDRDPTDTVATGIPSLSAQVGAQTLVTPSVAGNFNITCWYDADGNGTYNAGEELRVLHLVVVRLTVQAADGGSTISNPGTHFVGSVSPTDSTQYGVQSDQDVMTLQCTFVLEGGGANRLIGVSRISVGTIQNLTATTFTINYPGNVAGTGVENPGDQLPVIDCGDDPTGGSSVFLSLDVGGDNDHGVNISSGGQRRTLTSLDNPGFGPWYINHPKTHNVWMTTQGGYTFKDFISAFSDTFPKYYVVLARGDWLPQVIGSNHNGTWTDSGSSTVTIPGATEGTANLAIMGTNGSPTSGDAAGVQVLGKAYVVHRSITYNPSP
jgi:hypothetical protein